MAKTWKVEEGVKRIDEIRMVYDATKSGLNDAVWAPWFSLPTIDTKLRSVKAGTYMCDCDVGEMFLNFMLHPEIRAHAGVDLTQLYSEELMKKSRTVKARWERMMMGFSPSPYFVTKDMLFVERIAKGCRFDEDNVYRWKEVILNLPGMISYDTTLPWVYKAREDGSIAADIYFYIDDGSPTADTTWESWKACKRACYTLSYLGLQEASRKRTGASQRPGEWAGTKVETDSGEVNQLVSQKKWIKGKTIISRLIEELDRRGCVNHEQLEKDRGFLIYLSRTYKSMCPYLKGVHLSLDSWRKGRDNEGWKQNYKPLLFSEEDCDVEDAYAPIDVFPVPRLRDDLFALNSLLEGEIPKRVKSRLSKSGWVSYGIGDASGNGYGAAVHLKDRLSYRYGQWASNISEQSSNYRELRNLVDTIEKLYRDGHLKDCELFLFTDNLVADYAYHKGTSTSKLLFDLVLRLRKLQMKGDFILHLFHISGERMKACGIDALSRSCPTEGVMQGENMLSFLPLSKTAAERSGGLLSWVKTWWPEEQDIIRLMIGIRKCFVEETLSGHHLRQQLMQLLNSSAEMCTCILRIVILFLFLDF